MTRANLCRVDAVLSPPYGVEVIHSTVRSIAVKWQPPIHVPPHQEILYTVYYQATNATGNVTEQDELPNTVTTMFTQLLLTNLTYDTQYKISVQARTPEGDRNSPMSEVSRRTTIRLRLRTANLSVRNSHPRSSPGMNEYDK